MAIVQKLKKTKDTKTCRDLGEVFIKRVKLESRQYDEVYLIFDRYIEGSLKERTRHKCTGGKGIQYKVTDNTRIDNIPLKKFLSHIETKQELTVYLARCWLTILRRIILIMLWHIYFILFYFKSS